MNIDLNEITHKVFAAYLEPRDCGDGVAYNIEKEEGIRALLCRHLVSGLHILGLFSLGGQGCGCFVPVLKLIKCYRSQHQEREEKYAH